MEGVEIPEVPTSSNPADDKDYKKDIGYGVIADYGINRKFTCTTQEGMVAYDNPELTQRSQGHDVDCEFGEYVTADREYCLCTEKENSLVIRSKTTGRYFAIGTWYFTSYKDRTRATDEIWCDIDNL